jgi:hypothetical protein
VISDVYDCIVEAFRRYKCPANVYLGEQFRAQHTGPLRVVIYQGQSSPADQFTGALPAQLLPTQTIQYINPRPVATRRSGFSAELWATAPKQRSAVDQYRADLAYLDALVNQFGVALQQLASGIFMIQSGVAAAGNADAAVAGLGYTLQCVIDVPIIDAEWPAQQLSKCTETWAHHPATAEVSVQDTQTEEVVPPVFSVPTPTE